MEKETETTASISLHAFELVCNSVDQEIESEFSAVFAQERTRKKAINYAGAVSDPYLAAKSAWDIAEYCGYETPGPVHSLIGENKWSPEAVWNRTAVMSGKLAAKDAEHDPLGAGIIFDETADLKRGKMTCGTGYQHAGCAGKVANCSTWVMATLTGPSMRAWAAADLFLPGKDWFTGRGETGTARRKAAGIPMEVKFATKPVIALRQLRHIRSLGIDLGFGGGDEIYGRYGGLRKDHEENGEAYAYFVPRNQIVECCDRKARRVDRLPELGALRWETRPAGAGVKGPRYYDWAMIGLYPENHFLLLRRPLPKDRELLAESAEAEEMAIFGKARSGAGTISGKMAAKPGTDWIKEEMITFCLCYIPPGKKISPTLGNLVLMTGRRWGAEEVNETAKGPVGWDENQFRKWVSMNHHTALAGIAALRANMILQRLEAISKGDEEVPEAPQGELIPARPGIARKPAEEPSAPGGDDLMIPTGDSEVPDHADQEIPRGIGYIKLSRNEVLRIIAIAKSGMNDKEKAFHLRWSKWRRKHQATSRWYHRIARMRLAREPGNRSTVHDLTTVRSARLGRQSKADPKRRDTAEAISNRNITL